MKARALLAGAFMRPEALAACREQLRSLADQVGFYDWACCNWYALRPWPPAASSCARLAEQLGRTNRLQSRPRLHCATASLCSAPGPVNCFTGCTLWRVHRAGCCLSAASGLLLTAAAHLHRQSGTTMSGCV